VTRSDTKAPLPNARVELTSEDYARLPTGHERVCKPEPDTDITDKRRFVSTDINGKFTITNVAAGRYYLSAQHEGFLRASYGQRADSSIGLVLRINPEGDALVATPEPDVPGEDAAGSRVIPLESLGAGTTRDSNQQRPVAGAPSAIRGGTIAQTGQRGGLGREAERLPEGAGAGTAISAASGTPKIRLQDLSLSLTPAPTIAGSVVDDQGKPQAAATVQAYQFRFTPINGRTLKSARTTLTDDEGNYRLFWLEPGRYIVAAAHTTYGLQPWMSGLRLTPNLPNPDEGQPTVFYSAATTAANAVPVPLNPGEQPNAYFRLQERPRFTFRVRLEGSRLPSNATLVFVPYGGDLCAGPDYGISPKSDGTFEIRDVPEGLYVAMAMAGRDVISPLITVRVDSQPPAPIPLPIVPSTTVQGFIAFDTVPPGLDPGTIRVNLVRTGQEVHQVATGVVDPSTGHFAIPGLGPGSYYPVVDMPPGGFVLTTIATKDCKTEQPSPSYAYQDLHGHLDPQRPLSIPGVIPNAAQALCIHASFGHVLRGYVRDSGGKFLAGAMVVAIPKSVWAIQEDRGATPPDRYLTAVTDDRGYFEIQGVTEVSTYVANKPGSEETEYHLYAFESIDPNAIYDPGFSERFQNRGIFSVKKWVFEDGRWQGKGNDSATIAAWHSCGANDVIDARTRCYLTSIPAADTAEIR